MAKKRYLRKKQLDVMEELVNGELDEQKALKKLSRR